MNISTASFLSLTFLLATAAVVNADSAAAKTDGGESKAKLDQLYARVQAICPVSGRKLGSHGSPIKVAIGKQKQQVFLCCRACKSGKLNPDHWATIHKNIKKAQTNCPVMGKPLPEKSAFTIAGGKVVYVCCPPCTDKIEADPNKFLSKVQESYRDHVDKDPHSR